MDIVSSMRTRAAQGRPVLGVEFAYLVALTRLALMALKTSVLSM